MRISTRGLLGATLLLVLHASLVSGATGEDYARAERIRRFDNRTIGGTVFPHWLKDGRRFYYQSFAAHEMPGTVFLIDPVARSSRALFTTTALASELARAAQAPIDSRHLPPWRLLDAAKLTARVGERDYECLLAPMACHAAALVSGEAIPEWAVRSPDGKWDAFIWNYNVYIRPSGAAAVAGAAYRAPKSDASGNHIFPLSESSPDIVDFQVTGQRSGCDWPAPPGPIPAEPAQVLAAPADSIALSDDGEPLYSYGPRFKLGAEPATLDADRYRPTRGSIVWSPDSTKFVIRREDLRGVGTYPLYSSTSDQPIDHSYYYASPGAAHIPQFDLYVLDVTRRTGIKIDVPPTSLILSPSGAQWSADSRALFVISSDRGSKKVVLSEVDALSGHARPVIVETSKTFVEMSNGGWSTIAAVSPTGQDIIWFSERDDWGHLYRYGRDGRLKQQIDSGHNSIAELIHVDFAREQIYYTAWGRAAGNPYYRHLYRINFDGRGLTALTPEEGDHLISVAPDASYLLDTHQAVDLPPLTTARTLDGRTLMSISRGSDAQLRATGWHPAETFTVKARDDATDLYGVLYKPANLDPAKRYPVIVNIYPGPFMGSVGRDWHFQGGDSYSAQENLIPRVTHGEGMGQSLAELGFIVIKLNSLGTAQRSKSMQDFFYGNVIDNGLPDQIAAVRQLAERHAWIDAARVGITGHSGGGFAAAAGLLTHPEFFKVGVAQSGNHDFRTYGWYWGEQYMGPLNSAADHARYARQANASYAANLQGKLLLIHGDMDCNNPPAQTLRLVDALTRLNKNFDLMIVPEAGHQLPSYAMRRSWDYFVDHLAGEPLPVQFEATEPDF